MFIKGLVTPCSAVGFPHLLYKPSNRIWNIKQMKSFGCKPKKYWPCHIFRNLQSLLPPLFHQNLSISLKTLSILSITFSNDWQPLIWFHLGSTYHVKTYWPKKWDQNINQSFPKKTCLLLGNSFKVLGLSSTSFGGDPFIAVFQIQFCLLTEIMSHIHLSGLVLFHCWNRLLSKLIFNGFVKFKNQIQSIKVCQGNWLCIVCTAHSSTASNISSIFHPSHLISHFHQYLQQLIFVI